MKFKLYECSNGFVDCQRTETVNNSLTDQGLLFHELPLLLAGK